MARGHQKIQSQQKAQKKAEALKKSQGCDQRGAAQKALHHKCTVCMAQMPDPKTYKQHFESRHPKTPLPLELVNVQA
ncbi:hypothetical protein ANCCEY_12585 [Ancylostoma ceylanicum]|uniref:Small EDRK-rich factor-like N-terminal domain-containing protein n=2 Tax=Ancylostoma ceylanicum TaxID=53326 RepID=A0A016WCH1_9BILA|nr:hypothetical protein ANCCEY_12585 [Ancylostoma ceylanicum]EYC36698.1 hypothetical protein Y032_0866g2766 [Ancylostoma ceylanicum]EYC36699.1 hypothetical protein Y032_0866g2767 [Ancylostoma ceylanicum]